MLLSLTRKKKVFDSSFILTFKSYLHFVGKTPLGIMYYPLGWPRLIDFSIVGSSEIRQICYDRVKILIAVIADDFLGIWYAKPLVPIVFHRRLAKSMNTYGNNSLVTWKPDSVMIAVATGMGNVLIYTLSNSEHSTFNQTDSPFFNLRRDSPELFTKEAVPSFSLTQTCTISFYVSITSMVCVSLSQIMVATTTGKIFRLQWDGSEDTDFIIDLRKACLVNQQSCQEEALIEENQYINSMDYSPLLGGFAVTFTNGKAAFLTAFDLKFESKGMQLEWAHSLEDATCCSVNHKFRLLAFGRENSQAAVYTFEDSTGRLELSHNLVLSMDNFSKLPGAVNNLKWSPDGCVVVMSWKGGGFSVWSTFGTMLMCSLSWDYGLNADLVKYNPFNVQSSEWSAEGYQLFLIVKDKSIIDSEEALKMSLKNDEGGNKPGTKVMQMDFVKSTLSVNPCMTQNFHILLQGDDKLFINQGKSLETYYFNSNLDAIGKQLAENHTDDNLEVGKSINFSTTLSGSKHWIVVQLPLAYSSTNWPIRYTAIDTKGVHLAAAGRTGLAHYSMLTGKWKMFGNESQEKDFVVTGGLMWWYDFIIMGSYSLIDQSDEIRAYPKMCKLDNQFVNKIKVKAPVMLLNSFKNKLLIFLADGKVQVFELIRIDSIHLNINYLYEIDVRSLCIHPACVVSISATNIKNEVSKGSCSERSGGFGEAFILNVSGRILMVQPENDSYIVPQMSTCLASTVECIWISTWAKSYMKDSIWLYSGCYGMRLWLPVLPCDEDVQRTYRHTFMLKRIMMTFPLRLYPLAIPFEDVIILGVENDTVLYINDSKHHFSLPFSILEKKSQIFLHKILRQLIRRNLGYTAWEIARSCSHLPYFSHSLELLLHEVLEDEATSKEPIPDALLPSVLEFIKEFPVYLQAIVQCARKTEIALWPYLFTNAGKPKDLFQQCLSLGQLECAASYLVILQNLEPSAVSRQYATLLLDTALDSKKWELARDLVRFLKAIDPEEVESPRTSFIINSKIAPCQQTQQINPNPEDMSLILGTITRGRSFSTTLSPQTTQNAPNYNTSKEKTTNPIVSEENNCKQNRKRSVPNMNSPAAEDFFIEVILQRHARKLLQTKNLRDLGYMSASLDFHLVGWLAHESNRAARVENFIDTLNLLHKNLCWPKPGINTGVRKICMNDSEPNISHHLDFLHLNEYNTYRKPTESGYSSQPTIYDKLHLQKEQFYNFSDKNEENHDEDTASLRYFTNKNSCLDDVSEFNADDFPLSTAENSDDLEKEIPQKLEIQIRYLLQLFIEANCWDFALLLSVLLLDAASVNRIVNTVMRSGSVNECRKILQALRSISQWSSQECLGYASFMIKLKPQEELLMKFLNNRINRTLREESKNIGKTPSNSIEDEKEDKPKEIVGYKEKDEFLWANSVTVMNHPHDITKPSLTFPDQNSSSVNSRNQKNSINNKAMKDDSDVGCKIM